MWGVPSTRTTRPGSTGDDNSTHSGRLPLVFTSISNLRFINSDRFSDSSIYLQPRATRLRLG